MKIRVRDRDYSPEEIAAFVLREIKEFCEEALGEEIKEAIITVPAYFDDSQRQATRDAGRIAGLEVLRIINEPTAAALAYGLEQNRKQETIAVYDLGGGTFDISILRIDNGMFEVLSTSGDTFLGGEDFDRAIMDWLLAEFLQSSGIDLRQDRLALQRLKEAAEKAKCELSTALETMIALPFIASDASGPKHINKVLTRDTFEALAADLIARTEGPCQNALEAAGLSPDQVDTVILVGGQTRTPRVQQMVETIFGEAPEPLDQPRRGRRGWRGDPGGSPAAERSRTSSSSTSRRSRSASRRTAGSSSSSSSATRRSRRRTLRSSRPSPTTRRPSRSTSCRASARSRRRTSPSASSSSSGSRRRPRACPQIEVTFAIDSSGIVNVSARDLATGKAQGLQINPAGGLSQTRSSGSSRRRRRTRRSTRRRKEIRQLKNKLEGMIGGNDRIFREFGNLLQPDEKDRVERTLDNAREVLTGDERGPIDDALIDMKGVSRILTQAMLYKPESKERRGSGETDKGAEKPA